MGLRDYLHEGFDVYKTEAEGSNFARLLIRDMDREELLALVGWLMKHYDASTHPGNRTTPRR
jgi:hypothetical protein